MAYKLQSRSSESQVEARKTLVRLFDSSPIPTEEMLQNLGLFVRSGAFAKFLFLDELYRQIVSVPGDIVEFGTWWGQSLVTFLNLRAVYEPYAARKVIGFDTFAGYPSITDHDRGSETIKIGGYAVSENYQAILNELLEYHEAENVLSQIKKFELVAGDVSLTSADYYRSHPEAIVALAFFDMALYEPTKAALLAIRDRLVPGSILAFDELNDPEYPGETEAVREVLGLRSARFVRSRYLPARTYAVIGTG
jgi:macrocin-O-methyltransferase TylF-like protien